MWSAAFNREVLTLNLFCFLNRAKMFHFYNFSGDAMLLAEAMKKEKKSIIDLESMDAATVQRIASVSKIKTSNKSTVGIKEVYFHYFGRLYSITCLHYFFNPREGTLT